MFARYPNIRWLMPHAGGVTPFLTFRMRGWTTFQRCTSVRQAGVGATLKSLYFDIAQATHPAPLRALMEVADPSRVMFGTDFPVRPQCRRDRAERRGGLEAFDGFDGALRRKVARDNALTLFPRLA